MVRGTNENMLAQMEFMIQSRDIFGTNGSQKLAAICAAAQMKFGVICAAGQVLKTKKKSLQPVRTDIL